MIILFYVEEIPEIPENYIYTISTQHFFLLLVSPKHIGGTMLSQEALKQFRPPYVFSPQSLKKIN